MEPDLHLMHNTVYQIRKTIIEMAVPHETHHIGCSLGIVDILTTLYFSEMKVFPDNPSHTDRDIFVLSKGHGAAALYATLFVKGFFQKEKLDEYDRDGGTMPEHASVSVPGVELSTGSLGHGLPVSVGFAVSFLRDKKNNTVFTLLSDGELNEGSNWEAIMFAAHHKLSNLIAIIDLNGYQGYGETTKVLDLSPLSKKFSAFNWDVHEVNGNDTEALIQTFKTIRESNIKKPHIIIAKTVKGHGIPYFEGKFESHYKSMSPETREEILKHL